MSNVHLSKGKGLFGALVVGAALGLALVSDGAFASETGLRGSSERGFTGLSVYTATGYQNATIKGSNLKVQGTDITLPSQSETKHSTFWLLGLDYTHVFANQFSLGAQFDYYPKSGQYALSLSPGYEFNDRVMGYVRLGWANVPTTVAQGPGQPNYKKWLNAYFVGVGTRVNIYRGVFGYAEVRYSEVERLNFTGSAVLPNAPQLGPVPIQGSADTTAVNAFIGLGYRF
ncbi:MAG: hypothetical protein LRY56_00565 [Burkholderiaceae bacterium]|nr:hypothetical protein [Burkholderiaceae bacterium]MCD8536073.1 hypothetical protein [Burkholderiaceae bacterium]